MSFIETPNCDQLGQYLVDNLSTTTTSYLKCDSMGVVKNWIEYWGHFPTLSKVALRTMATLVSSARSERHFSVVSRLVTADSSYLGDGVIADMTFLTFVFMDLTFDEFFNIIHGINS